jgi:hypothetical protein
VISAKVAALTEGVVKTMFVTKIKGVLAVVLVVGIALAGAAGLIYQAQAAGQPASPTSARAAFSTTPNQGVREAATRAVRLIDRTSATFLTTRTCFTCHTQTLSAMVLRDARKVGLKIDEANFKRQYQRAIEDLTGTRVDTKGHMLWALDIGQYAPDDKTEATVEYVLNYQKHHGTWQTTVDRPPSEASSFTTNYVALRGLNRYGTAKQREAIATRTTAVKKWLESANAVDTEDQVFRLRLAHELKLPSDKVDHYVQRLLREQEADGGWAQNRQMKSDAYATGSVLVALHEAGGLSCQHSAWQRGLGYLLRTQKPDGSWHVVSRAKPLMEYFESGFPHGKDQFISAFATGWATEALLMSLAQDKTGEKNIREGPATKEVLIDKALAAHGGEDKLNKLTSFTMTVKHSNGETQHYFVQPPKNFRWETTHRDRTSKRIVILFPEGRRWWTKEPNGDAKEFIPTGIEPLRIEGWLDYVKFFGPRQVLRLKDADHKVTLLDEEAKIGDRAAVGVRVTGPHYNHKMYFDKETHLVLKSFGVNLREVTYSDYKTFDGIPIAQKEHDGHFEPEITDFRAVPKFDAKLFERP